MPASFPPLRIATRASALALWQAEHVAALLRGVAGDRDIELVKISTQGDRDQKEPLHEMGGIGVCTREVQTAVLEREADLAVHSLKDLPTQSADGLVLGAVPERASVFDALVLPKGSPAVLGWDSLPPGATLGTGSLRRQSQVRFRRPDLALAEVRGNVPTRLDKLDQGRYDALILAVAGLERLGLGHRISWELRPPDVFPAVGQGALGIECREDDSETRGLLAKMTDPFAMAAVTAERALLAELEAGCHAPLGALSTLAGDRLTLEAVVLDPQGHERLQTARSGSVNDPVTLGKQVAAALLALGAARLM